MNLRAPLPLLLLLTLSGSSVQAAVSWNFDYTGSVEFDTSELGMARRASLESAAVTVGSWFNHTATVTIAVSSKNEAGSSTLASAGSNFPGGFTPGFGSSGYVRSRILTGVGNPAGADGTVNVNFTHNWDLDDSIAANAFDFKSTMIHELLHATGFSSDITQAGQDGFSTESGSPGMFTLFDKFLTDAAGTPIIDPNFFVLNVALWNTVSVGSGAVGNVTAGGVYFSGPKAMAGNGNMPIRIFSPNPWQDGSSGSHLDDLFYEANLMMKAATLEGPGARALTAFETGVLEDLGYSMVGATTLPSGPLAAWRATFFGNATERIGNAEDFDGDGKSNLMEFAQGTNPALAGSGPDSLEYNGTLAGGGTLAKAGQPIVSAEDGGDPRALYVRRKDFAAAGLTYVPRFSSGLTTWQNSAVAPTVLADDGTNQVVSVPFPAAGPGGKAFFLLEVSITP